MSRILSKVLCHSFYLTKLYCYNIIYVSLNAHNGMYAYRKLFLFISFFYAEDIINSIYLNTLIGTVIETFYYIEVKVAFVLFQTRT